ncbi:hypothetical protein [Thalassoroseus pseudoceratinae]|uniref:hypothetical protein n=1 Tax=Thalassoroseus pseudoceratinae TaxID=2713176 RepID=UPI0014244123|nr:hypothetical protein [Thalassoroseus pseudoceratinae]
MIAPFHQVCRRSTFRPLFTIPGDQAESNVNHSGFEIYRDGSFTRVRATYEGQSAGTRAGIYVTSINGGWDLSAQQNYLGGMYNAPYFCSKLCLRRPQKRRLGRDLGKQHLRRGQLRYRFFLIVFVQA